MLNFQKQPLYRVNRKFYSLKSTHNKYIIFIYALKQSFLIFFIRLEISFTHSIKTKRTRAIQFGIEAGNETHI